MSGGDIGLATEEEVTLLMRGRLMEITWFTPPMAVKVGLHVNIIDVVKP